MTFILDPRLHKDTIPVGSNERHLLLMMNDSRYPWFIVVPAVNDVSEWFDLPPDAQQQLHQDCVQVGACIKQAFSCEKINIAALGNIVRQMHVHVIGRSIQDPAWPGPVWGHSPAVAYNDDQAQAMKSRLLAIRDLPFHP